MKEDSKKQATALRHHLAELEQRLNKVKTKGASNFARQLAFQSQVGYYQSVRKEIENLESEDDLVISIKDFIVDMIDLYFPDASIATKERLLEESFLLLSEQEDLEPEFAELMNKHFHDLIKE